MVNSPVFVSTIAMVCCLACRSQPTIFISASFVPSLFWLDTAKSTRSVVGPDVVMTSVTSESYEGSIPSSAMRHQKSTICHTFLVGLTSNMASNRPSGDGIAYPMKLLEWSRTETLPSSGIFSNALSRC